MSNLRSTVVLAKKKITGPAFNNPVNLSVIGKRFPGSNNHGRNSPEHNLLDMYNLRYHNPLYLSFYHSPSLSYTGLLRQSVFTRIQFTGLSTYQPVPPPGPSRSVHRSVHPPARQTRQSTRPRLVSSPASPSTSPTVHPPDR